MDGVPTYVIELVPQREDIGYKKIVIWLGRDDLVPRRLEFYGDASDPTKRIVQRDLHDVGSIPMARHVEVETPARGSKHHDRVVRCRVRSALRGRPLHPAGARAGPAVTSRPGAAGSTAISGAELEAIAARAGALALEHFREVTPERKPDRTLVTTADRAVEALIAHELAERWPDAAIVAEEGTDREGRGRAAS